MATGVSPPESEPGCPPPGARDGLPCSFASHLLDSRLRPPQPLLQLVRRDRLLQQLPAGRTPLVVVAAPAGSGKTVALSQWAESDARPFAWLQVDEADNDPLLFLHYLVAVLGGVAELDPLMGDWLQQAPPPAETRILPALAAGMSTADPFVFVLDDVHLLTNEICWRIVGLLFEQLPSDARLCLSGRAPPPLPLARLRSSGRLLEVGPAELALSSRETGELLRLHGVAADAETVAHLTDVTEGWAAGVYLAALAGAQLPAAGRLTGIRGNQRDIARFLASEVLEQQPAELALFLLQTSILERLSPGLCRAVTGNPRAGDLLRTVARSNLFVSALDDADEWFRYHHLFAEFLQAELALADEAEAAALHGRAAAWFEAHDQLEEAVRHWLAAGEAGRAGAIVCRAHMGYSRCARYETVRRWLEMFTDEQIFSDRALTLAAGWIGVMADDSSRGSAWTKVALRIRVGDGLWPDTEVPLRLMQAGLIASLAPAGVTQMRENAEFAAAMSDGAHPAERAFAIAQLGIALWLCGDSEAALPRLREGEDLGAVANVLAQVTAAGYQALILADEGRWDEARARTASGLSRFEEAGLSWGVPTYPTLLALARVQAHDGDPALAESVAIIATIAAQGNTAAFMALLCEVIAGEALAERGDLAEASRWMHAGFARLASWPDAGILRPRLLRLRESLEQRLLLDPLTPAERRVLQLLPSELNLGEIAAKLWVSRETVRTHAKDIYRKLEVHSRREAVARARELDLLTDA